MAEDSVIKVDNVTKRFRIYLDRGFTLKELFLSKRRRKYDERTVLENITFSISRGETIGIIGNNGCGKSTLLKLLTRIIYPDSGNIEVNGKVSSLLELGAGFHPDMTGRENIYINASILGLSKREIDERLNEIIEFSELKKYIDEPVRTYSSGMYMRLAFSVAINVNADILLIDEILAVGDFQFQNKCLQKLRSLQEQGVTTVIVSHSMEPLLEMCNRCIWIEAGKIQELGCAEIVIGDYLNKKC